MYKKKILKRPSCLKFKGKEVIVKVKNELTKTLSLEGYDLRGMIGRIRHELDDGYTLVLFDELIYKEINNGKRTLKKREYLQRYIHQNDLNIINFVR